MSNASACNNVIKLRGLPWNVTNQEILKFLTDIEVKGGEDGIHLITSPKDGRPNGEAFIECATEKDFDAAFDHNKKVMGHRYIESEFCCLSKFNLKKKILNENLFISKFLPPNLTNFSSQCANKML